MYKTILVAFDGSEYSRAALIESSNLAKRHGGKVIMVHAVYFDEEEFSLAPEQREKRFELGKKVCYQARETISSEFGIEVESLICEGEPPDVITDIAAGKKADLIAMGTYGRKGLKRLVMGSVTSKVIINAPCDVMVVKRPCSEYTGEYESILVLFDGSQFSKKALEHAYELSRKDNAEITVLYVIPRYEEMVGFFRTESIKQNLYQEAQKIMDEAKKIAVSNGVSISTTIQEGQAAEKIIETANALKNDLMIMGSYGWRGINKVIIGSTTERVIMNASCPVLVVK
ncbi:universal stress protein [Dissulfurispira sp.]|uniref:universal stress protein n=1 Tax=Dissulfurispira sp. TaxID=2817609 RepID=UPI002FD99B01